VQTTTVDCLDTSFGMGFLAHISDAPELQPRDLDVPIMVPANDDREPPLPSGAIGLVSAKIDRLPDGRVIRYVPPTTFLMELHQYNTHQLRITESWFRALKNPPVFVDPEGQYRMYQIAYDFYQSQYSSIRDLFAVHAPGLLGELRDDFGMLLRHIQRQRDLLAQMVINTRSRAMTRPSPQFTDDEMKWLTASDMEDYKAGRITEMTLFLRVHCRILDEAAVDKHNVEEINDRIRRGRER
jgi:hypothetical protein